MVDIKIIKDVNNPLTGYVLYERDINEEKLIECINNVYNSSKLFRSEITSGVENNLRIKKIDILDEIKYNDIINRYLIESFDSVVIEVTLIYFYGNLRGFLLRTNPLIINEISFNNIFRKIEAEYFQKKYKVNFIENKTNFSNYTYETKNTDYSNFEEIFYYTTNETEKIKNFSDNTFNFFASVISYYFEKINGKKFIFHSNSILGSKVNEIGKEKVFRYFNLEKSSDSVFELFRTDFIECSEIGNVSIDKRERLSINGKTKRFSPKESYFNMEFVISEGITDTELVITYLKTDSKDSKVHIEKIRDLIHSIIYKTDIELISLLSPEDKEVVLSLSNPTYERTKKIYDLFVKQRVKNSSKKVLIENTKSYTYLDLSTAVLKLITKIEKFNVQRTRKISSNIKTDFEMLTVLLALDSLNCIYVYSENESSLHISSSLFGLKVRELNLEITRDRYQFISEESKLLKSNIKSYCTWFCEYFKGDNRLLLSATRSDVNFIYEAFPILISGGTLISKNSNKSIPDQLDLNKVTITRLKPSETQEIINRYKGQFLEHVIIDNYIKSFTTMKFKIHSGMIVNSLYPYISLDEVKNNLNEVSNIQNGIGLLILNKSLELCGVDEIGALYLFGPELYIENLEECNLTINNEIYNNVFRTDITGKWSRDKKIIIDRYGS